MKKKVAKPVLSIWNSINIYSAIIGLNIKVGQRKKGNVPWNIYFLDWYNKKGAQMP